MRTQVIYITLLLVLVPFALKAQVSTEPAIPAEEQPVTIIFNAENTPLEGFDQVYTHTGVNLVDGPDWQYVIGEWGDNDEQPELEQDDENENIFRLEIDNIREFYGVEEGEQVDALAFVFRSADENTQTEDLFVSLLTDEMIVRIDRPAMSRLNPLFAEVGDEFELEAVAGSPFGSIAEMRLYVDEELSATVASDQFNYTLKIENEGRTELRVEAEDDEGNVQENTSFIMVNEPVEEQPRPDGIEDGITYHEDETSVTHSMYAPLERDFVYVVGDFNDWEIDPDYMMKRDTDSEFADGEHYWLEIDGLQPGEEYGFQYFVDGEVRTGDLFSNKVLDPWNDHYLINDGTYPDLMPYPDGKTEGMVSVMHPGAEEYDWQADDYERPPQDELVIYELVIRDFLDEGTYANMADTLDYFERLGVNAIELMPVSQFDGNLSWGYNPAYHLAVEKAYGPAEDLKRFIDEAHQRDIAVILDVVYNHATGSSPLIQLEGSNPDHNPLVGPGHAFNVFNHLNHEHPYIQYWMDRANEFWLEEFNVDGYRFDLTKGFVNNQQLQDNVNAYNEERVENLKRMGDELWSVDDEAYIILEHFQSQEDLELAEYGRDRGFPGMMFWNNMNHQYNEATMGYSSNLNDTYYRNIGLDVANGITYMESHDEQWLMFKNLTFGNRDFYYSTRELPTALERQKIAGAFFFTVPGPRMMWQFSELGYGGKEDECLRPGDGSLGDCPPGTPGRTAEKPVRWEYYEDEDRRALFDLWSNLLELREEHEVFRSTDTDVSLDVATAAKSIVLEHESMDVVIIGNFDIEPREVEVEFSQNGTWHSYLDARSHEVSNDEFEASWELNPAEFVIFTTEELDSPAEILAIEYERPELNLSSPEEGITIDEFPFSFEWEELARAEEYQVQVAPDQEFSDDLTLDTLGTDSVLDLREVDERHFSPEHTYYWRVRGGNDGGNSDWSAFWDFGTGKAVSVESGQTLPEVTELADNYPNPFNPTTTIPFRLSEQAEVTIEIFDLLGRRVAMLVENEAYQPGTYRVTFDGSNLGSGSYIIRMQTGAQTFTDQMMLVK